MMRFKKVIGIAAVLAFAAGAAFAQPVTEPKKAEASAGKVSKSLTYDEALVQGYNDNQTPLAIIDMVDPNSEPIVLTRSFRDALKENCDKETAERLAK